jgi:hypothetical protein
MRNNRIPQLHRDERLVDVLRQLNHDPDWYSESECAIRMPIEGVENLVIIISSETYWHEGVEFRAAHACGGTSESEGWGPHFLERLLISNGEGDGPGHWQIASREDLLLAIFTHSIPADADVETFVINTLYISHRILEMNQHSGEPNQFNNN